MLTIIAILTLVASVNLIYASSEKNLTARRQAEFNRKYGN